LNLTFWVFIDSISSSVMSSISNLWDMARYLVTDFSYLNRFVCSQEFC
jgi:hypothetical protein